ncbi:MAG TPA: hypothetical protein VKU93_03830 [Terracidiphilus sp.]|nr:hypothetical protein [Terracidiphilus sp.]
MSNTSVSTSILRCMEQRSVSARRLPSRTLIIFSALLLALPTAWCQAAPAFSIDGGGELPSTINISTAPGVATFNNEIFTVWCGHNNYIQSSFQATVTSSPTIYTSSISCNSGNTGRIAVTAFTPIGHPTEVYAVGQPLNYDTPYAIKIISSTDGINWQEQSMNLEYYGYPDYSSQGFGMAVLDNQLYFAYLSSYTGTVSVASSTDGENFYWVSTASAYPMVQNPSTWIQSPALYYWVNEFGQGDLYLGYLTTGGEVVVSYSPDGENWTTQIAPGTILKRDLMFVSHNSALYYGGQSYYSEDNLWMAGSYDGYNWPAAVNYGSIMRTSPSAVDFNGYFYDVIAGCCNSNIYGYYANPN